MGKRYEAVSPVEYQQNNETKTKWVKCGSAFQNDNGVFTIWLDALPVNGKLILKEPKPYNRQGGGGQGGVSNQGNQSNYDNRGGGQQQNYQGGGQQENRQQTGFGDDNTPF